MSDSNTQTLREIARLKGQNSRLRSVNNKLAERGAGYDDFISELKKLNSFDYNFKLPKFKKEKKSAHTESVGIILSDVHMSEVIQKSATLGTEEFGPVVVANKMWHHVETIKSIINIHRKAYSIDKIYLWILGDIHGGSIHSLGLTNAMTDPACTILCSRLLTIFVNELSTLGVPVEVCTSVGNHGRIGQSTMPSKRQAHTNWDWLIYEMLSDNIKSNKLVSMDISTAQIGIKKIYDHTFVYEHGIDISSGKEDMLETKLRNMLDNKCFRQSINNTGQAFDMILIGNTHVAKTLPKMIVNGAYMSNSELGLLWRLPPSIPQQMMFGISNSRPRTWTYSIDLGDVKDSANPITNYTKLFMEKYNN